MINLIWGDALEVLRTLPAESIDVCLTSPPYWKLKDYGTKGQIGQEATLPEYLAHLFSVFEEVRRVLKPTGTLWINIGDTYAGDSDMLPKKCLLQVPARLTLMLTDTGGWILRSENIWHKNNAMPFSGKDRPTIDYEKVMFLSKTAKGYYYKQLRTPATSTDTASKASKQNLSKWVPDGKRNLRTTWRVKPGPYLTGHPAAMPEALVELILELSLPPGGRALDPFVGSGTTCVVANRLEGNCTGIDLNAEFLGKAFLRLPK